MCVCAIWLMCVRVCVCVALPGVFVYVRDCGVCVLRLCVLSVKTV